MDGCPHNVAPIAKLVLVPAAAQHLPVFKHEVDNMVGVSLNEAIVTDQKFQNYYVIVHSACTYGVILRSNR